jgi:hypothetical protein
MAVEKNESREHQSALLLEATALTLAEDANRRDHDGENYIHIERLLPSLTVSRARFISGETSWLNALFAALKPLPIKVCDV